MNTRVVILSAFITPFRSGAEACAEEVAKALCDRYDITIVTARLRKDLPTEDRLGNVSVIRVGLGKPFDKWLFPFLAPFAARKLQPAIIHAVLETFAGLALLVCRTVVPHAKRMLTCQTTNSTFLLRPIHAAAHRITVISSVLKERAEKLGRKDAVVIPNGIPHQALAQGGMQKVKGRILFVGRLEHVKGVDTLIHAFAIVCSQGTDATLRIVGDGSRRQALEAQVWELRITESVTFMGYVSGPDLYRQYAEAQVFAGLSRSEALGNVFLEAQAAGCAVLATSVGGIPDSVRNGETGVLIAADDPGCAARELAKLLTDEVLRTRLARAGSENAKQYDWSGIALRYEQEYKALLA